MTNELTIKEVKELKASLENDIQAAVEKFQKDTGVLVEGIRYEYVDARGYDGALGFRTSAVRVVVEV